MSDVENEMEVLERKLAAKTREIESLVATQQNLGDPKARRPPWSAFLTT